MNLEPKEQPVPGRNGHNGNRLSIAQVYTAIGLVFIVAVVSLAFLRPDRLPQTPLPSGSVVPAPALDELLPSWAVDSPARKELLTFVAEVTDPANPAYVPSVHRVATFDMDGTLACEKSISIEAAAAVHRIETVFADDLAMQALKDDMLKRLRSDHISQDDWDFINSVISGSYEDLPVEDYEESLRNFLAQPFPDKPGLTWGDLFYRPMVEAVELLKQNGFDVYVVSGSDRAVVRVAAEFLNLPRDRHIGADIEIRHKAIGGQPDFFLPEDALACGSTRVAGNYGILKAFSIYREVGRRPIVAFGNSDGDFSMFNLAVYHPIYPGRAFLLSHDDPEREFEYDNQRQQWLDKAKEYRWTVVSMKNEFSEMFLIKK